MRFTGLFVLASAVVPVLGCGDDIKFPDPPPAPEPAINAVIPAEGFSGRTLRVQVSGDDTELTSAATLDFGAGITVSDISLGSPSDIFATLTIAPDAVLGEHDVKIKDGDVELTLTKAFDVVSPIELIPQGGDPQQGGFAFIAIVNHDVANPFPVDPTLIQITAGNGVNGFISQNDPFTAFATMLIDTDGTTGPVQLTYNFGTTQVMSRGPDLTITARTATALQPVGKGTGDLGASATFTTASGLFSFNATELAFGELFDDGSNPDAFPGFVFLPGGKWANARFPNFGTDEDRFPVLGNMFVVAFDTGTTGYGYDLVVHRYVDLTGFTQINQVEPNDTAAQAQTSTAVGVYVGDIGGIANPGDVDMLKVTVATGESIRAITTVGNLSGQTDTFVEILDTDGTTVLADTLDFGFAEDVDSGPLLVAGDYFVRVTQSSFCDGFFEVCDNYEAAIIVEPALALVGNNHATSHDQPLGVVNNPAAMLRR